MPKFATTCIKHSFRLVPNQCVGVFTTTYFPGGKYSLSKSLRFIHKYVASNSKHPTESKN